MTTLATRWPISRGQDDKHPSITRSTDRDGVWCKCPQKHSIARLQQWQKVSLLVTNLWLLKFNYLFSSKNFLKLQKRIKYGFIYVFVKWKKKYMQFFCLVFFYLFSGDTFKPAWLIFGLKYSVYAARKRPVLIAPWWSLQTVPRGESCGPCPTPTPASASSSRVWRHRTVSSAGIHKCLPTMRCSKMAFPLLHTEVRYHLVYLNHTFIMSYYTTW